MDQTLLTITQALQLVGLAPCFLVILYLLIPSKRFSLNLLPIAYFLSLVCSFTVPLLPTFNNSEELHFFVLLGEECAAALSYLLILQYIFNRPPPAVHFLVLGLPLIGSSSLLYSSTLTAEICFSGEICFSSEYLYLLYQAASTSLIFMLLILVIGRTIGAKDREENIENNHQYWLIISLILVNLCLLAIDLAYIAENIKAERYVFITTLMRLTFIYLVLTSMFRVFTKAFAINLPSKTKLSAKEKKLAERILTLLESEKLYRNPQLNRAALATTLGINEYQTSRIINMHFNKSFSELINEFRVNDAKNKLTESEDSITTIAFDAGYNSIASFNRVFKELVGASPSNYREQHKQQADA